MELRMRYGGAYVRTAKRYPQHGNFAAGMDADMTKAEGYGLSSGPYSMR